MQLQRDAQVQVDVEGIVMRDERLGRSAAGNGVQRRRLDLAKAPLFEVRADAADNFDAAQSAAEHVGIVDEVQIAVAQAEFHVLHAAPLVRVRLERFAEVRDLAHEDGRLAHAGLAEAPFDADEVAEVQVPGDAPALLIDLLLADHELHFAGPVPDIEEDCLALAAPKDDAPGRLHAWPLLFRQVRRERPDRRDGLMAIEPLPPGIDAQFFNAA